MSSKEVKITGENGPAQSQAAAHQIHLQQSSSSAAQQPPQPQRANYATQQPGMPPTPLGTAQKIAFGGVGAKLGAPKVPPLNFESTFNLADTPLIKEYDATSQPSGIQTHGVNKGGGQHAYHSTAQQMLTTEMDANKRPPVTVKQTDIIYLPDKGQRDSVLTFDVSRKMADLPPIQANNLNQGNSSARQRGNSSDRGGDLDRRSSVGGGSGSASYRNTNKGGEGGLGASHHYRELSDLMILSRQEASTTQRANIRDNLQARAPLGCTTFQDEMRKGVSAIGVSPDGHSVGILTKEFGVMVHDKISEVTFELKPLSVDLYESNSVQLTHLIGLRVGQVAMSDRFSIYISNNCSSIFVISDSERLVASWQESHVQTRVQRATQKFTTKEDLPPSRRAPLVRSNSNSRVDEKNKNQRPRTSSRLRDFFTRSSSKGKDENPEQLQSSMGGKLKNKVGTEQLQSQRSQSSSRLVEQEKKKKQKSQPVIFLEGHWTNITLHSSSKIDRTLLPLASSNAILFSSSNSQEGAFANGLPIRLGRGRTFETLSEFKDEGSLVSVKMYDYSTYISLFDTKLYNDLTDQDSPTSSKRDTMRFGIKLSQAEKDTDTRKVLVISHQLVEQDKLFKGGVWYQNPFYLIDKVTMTTEIEHLGLLPASPSEVDRNLICKCDNQGSLLAIAVNSIHKIYCQILFVNQKTKFVSVMKLFEFVTAEDNPPFDSKGKTNLQVDDFAWTNNDAFLILMLNTGAMAVLPRLGSQLLQIYNPTIINVHYKDASNFVHYKEPRGFNELIPKNEITAKVKKTKGVDKSVLQQSNGSSGYRIQMHPCEEAFIIYSGSVAYVMQLELEPELSELFNHENKSYFFMRFCFSMKNLSRDQETLAKIPQLLTSKLPICEFDKNQEKFQTMEHGTYAKRIQTASHITPWQNEDRRMDTMMSFDADFNEESEIVLLNFKHLLFAFRWNSQTTLNYLEWLVTVTNDIFFYFLKQSEPMYAYHALKISEFYIKEVLQKPNNINQFKCNEQELSNVTAVMQHKTYSVIALTNKDGLKDIGSTPPSNNETHLSLQKTSNAFKLLYQRYMDPVIEIYTNGLSSVVNTAESISEVFGQELKKQLSVLLPQPKTLEQKMDSKLDLVSVLPRLVASGDGSTGFQFQKNYILLAYYCLIQFRNYQAGNFNILFLIVSSYITKNHINGSFVEGLQKFTSVLLHNFSKLEKTDELDLFFGKCGNNMIKEAPSNIEVVRQWTSIVVPHQSVFCSRVLSKSSLSMLNHLNNARLIKTEKQEEIEVMVGQLRAEIQPIVKMSMHMQDLEMSEVVKVLKETATTIRETQGMYHRMTETQSFGLCLTIFANQLFYMCQSQTNMKTVSMSDFLDCVARQTIKMDKKSPINTISQHTKIYDPAFQHHKNPSEVVKARQSLMSQLQIKDRTSFKKFTAMLFAYLGDYHRSAQVLKPNGNQPGKVDQLIFAMLIQATALKTNSKNFLFLRETLQDYNMKNLKGFQQLHQTTERLNAMHTIKYVMAEISCLFQRIMHLTCNSFHYREYLWACFAMLPLGVAIIFKEQIGRDSIRNLKSILTYQTKNDNSDHETFPLKLVIDEFPLAKDFFQKTLVENIEHLEYILPAQAALRRRFFNQIQVILICFYDQHQGQVIFETADAIQEKSFSQKYINKQQSQANSTDLVSEKIISLLIKDFMKFVKIFYYVKIRADMRAMDVQVRQQRESNPARAIECQIIICCKVFEHMIHFPKFTNIQVHVRRALALLTHLLFHTEDVIRVELKSKVIVPIINMIKYNKLGRSNKQILNGLLDLCKQKNQEGFQQIITTLEGIIFERQSDATSRRDMDDGDKEDDFEFGKMIKEVLSWLNFSILPSIDFKGLNRKGHRRCIDAKKELFELAAKMQSDLNLPMTDFSLFFRGVNFEVKHINTFGFGQDELNTFIDLRSKDEENQAKTLLMTKAKIESLKNTTTAAAHSLPTSDVVGKKSEEEEQIETEVDLDKTLVHKLCTETIQTEMQQDSRLPHLDLDILCMGHKQLYNQPDLPKNLDVSDFHMNKGQAAMFAEIKSIHTRSKVRQMAQVDIETDEIQKKSPKGHFDAKSYAIQKMQESKYVKEHIRKKSINQQPTAFQNQFTLTDISSEEKKKEELSKKTEDASKSQTAPGGQLEKIEEPDSTVKASGPVRMGRIRPQKATRQDLHGGPATAGVGKMTKITLRKNSARRAINLKPAQQVPKIEQKRPPTVQFGAPRPPRASALGNKEKNNQESEKKQQPTETAQDDRAKRINEKKRMQNFNLVFLKKKSKAGKDSSKEGEEGRPRDQQEQPQVEEEETGTQDPSKKESKRKFDKVKMPFKMLTKSFATQPSNFEQLNQVIKATISSSSKDGASIAPKDETTAAMAAAAAVAQPNGGQQAQTQQKRKVKPFQVHLVKVSKKTAETSSQQEKKEQETSEKQPEKVMKNAHELSNNVGQFSRKSLMLDMMSKLDQIQSKAETLKKNLNKTGPQGNTDGSSTMEPNDQKKQ